MSFSCILIAFIICFSNLVFAILPNNLVFTPTAIFPDRLETEIGYQSTFYTVDGTSNHTGFYLNRTLSKHLVYGIEFYDPSGSTNIYHHIAIHLLRLFNNSNYCIDYKEDLLKIKKILKKSKNKIPSLEELDKIKLN